MEYHVPDNRWQIFGMDNFANYVEKAVVKGQFHPSVPADIVEAYKMAEYMMAHAYYHYPLYHEALSKVLRIIEMAVKFRCQQIKINLTQIAKRKGKQEEGKRVLKHLMDDIAKAEPVKKLERQF